MPSVHWLFAGKLCGLALAYFVTARLGLLLAISPGHASAVWPASGLALAALLLWGARFWPAIWVGATLATATTGASFPLAGLVGAGNSLEALLAVYVLRRVRAVDPLERARDVFAFWVVAGVLCAMVAPSVGLMGLWVAGAVPGATFWLSWCTWWLGDLAGVVVVTPLLLAWARHPRPTWDRPRALEALALGVLALATSLVIFGPWLPGTASHPLPYAVAPFLLWAAFRFGRRGAATVIAAVCSVATWGTVRGGGPFHAGSVDGALLLLQAFVNIVGVSGLALAAVVAERDRGEARLRRSRDELEALVEARTADLERANAALQADVRERKRAEDRLATLNECFLSFGSDPDGNIQRLVALGGRLLAATCALYNRLENGEIHSLGHWNAPPDFPLRGSAEGRICTDVIRRGSQEVVLIRNLQGSAYAASDPNVRRYRLQTYLGQAVRCADSYVGVFCALYQGDFDPGEADRELVGIVAAAIGVEEERRRTEKAQRESERFTRTIISSVGEGVVVYDRELRYRVWNAYMEEQTGIPAGEILGKRAPETFPHVREQGIDRLLERALTGETVRSDDFPYRVSATGRAGWATGTFRPHTDVTGQIIGVVATIHDITGRKRVEETLQRYRLLAENSRDIILFVRHRDGRILEANSAASGAYGYPPEELRSRTISDLRAGETHRALARQMEAADAAGILFETLHRRKDGSTFPVEVSSRGVDLGEERVLLSIVRDITERKRAEAERERLLRELQEALANVKTLSGLLPICASCKKIRDDTGYWTQVETYITARSRAQFSHGICPDCAQRLYPEIFRERGTRTPGGGD